MYRHTIHCVCSEIFFGEIKSIGGFVRHRRLANFDSNLADVTGIDILIKSDCLDSCSFVKRNSIFVGSAIPGRLRTIKSIIYKGSAIGLRDCYCGSVGIITGNSCALNSKFRSFRLSNFYGNFADFADRISITESNCLDRSSFLNYNFFPCIHLTIICRICAIESIGYQGIFIIIDCHFSSCFIFISRRICTIYLKCRSWYSYRLRVITTAGAVIIVDGHRGDIQHTLFSFRI